MQTCGGRPIIYPLWKGKKKSQVTAEKCRKDRGGVSLGRAIRCPRASGGLVIISLKYLRTHGRNDYSQRQHITF